MPIYDLKFVKACDDLVVATHGRGLFVLDDIRPLEQMSSKIQDSDFDLVSTAPWACCFITGVAGCSAWRRTTLLPTRLRELVIDYFLKKEIEQHRGGGPGGPGGAAGGRAGAAAAAAQGGQAAQAAPGEQAGAEGPEGRAPRTRACRCRRQGRPRRRTRAEPPAPAPAAQGGWPRSDWSPSRISELLERDVQGFAQLALAHADHHAPHAKPRSDVLVDGVGRLDHA